MSEKRERGRPPLNRSAEEAEAARLASKAKYSGKHKNVSLDADLVEALNRVCDGLEQTLGFRPNLSQAVRYLIRKWDGPQ